jgi:hypothetical protein
MSLALADLFGKVELALSLARLLEIHPPCPDLTKAGRMAANKLDLSLLI